VTDALIANVALHDGDFVIQRTLARSAFAITYQARDEKLRREVAIKEYFPFGCRREASTNRVLPDGLLSLSEFEDGRARFLEEARALAPFHHPHIVAVHTFFEANNTAYMVMEYLRGQTLLQLLEEKKRLDEGEVLRIARQLCEALEAVHAANRLHRDLKPENIMQTEARRIVLLDFGLSTRFESDDGYGTRQLGQALRFGTPGYAPLEQYTQAGAVSAATDVYALGATLYHLLTGETPPPATDRAFGARLESPRKWNPQLSTPVCDALLWALRMKPEARPQSVRDFAERLFGRDNIKFARAQFLQLLHLRREVLQREEKQLEVLRIQALQNAAQSTPLAPTSPTRTMTGAPPTSSHPNSAPPEEDSGCFQAAFLIYFLLWFFAAFFCVALFSARVLLFGW
jgi:F-box protein 11